MRPNACQRDLVAQRTHVRGLQRRVTDHELRRGGRELRYEFIMDVLVDEQSLGRSAHLARVIETPVDGSLDCGVDVRIREDDERPVSPELK